MGTRLHQAVVDSSPHAVYWKDTSLRYVGCNRKFAQLHGISDRRKLRVRTNALPKSLQRFSEHLLTAERAVLSRDHEDHFDFNFTADDTLSRRSIRTRLSQFGTIKG